MPLSVFPYLGNHGHGYDDRGQGFVRRYPDGGWRVYKESALVLTDMHLIFSRYDQTRMDAIRAFFNAHWFESILVYDPAKATSVDLTGAATLGRHTALFASDGDGEPPTLGVRNLGRCVYDIEITFALLD